MSETKYTDAERPIWVPHWPNTLGRLWQAIIATIAVVSISVYRGQLAIRGDGDWIDIGSMALLAFVICTWIGLNDNVIRWGIPIGFVRRVEDDAHGSGVSIPPRRAKLWLTALASIAAIGIGVALSENDKLAPVGIPIAGIAAVVLLVTLGFRSSVELRLFADGFVRRRRSWMFFFPRTRDILVRWNDVEQYEASTYRTSEKRGSGFTEPVLYIRATGLGVERPRDRLDEPNRMAIRIHMLAAEPNAILSLMKWCTDGPANRIRLTGYDSPDLLVPPPLRERLDRSRS
ncbi:hypothetical protein CH275_17730 [Rhodococcus sp. 06-235-1A]|uniref:hypothetical protein n=1 Tax=Rhodococcus sp. 06-235-1A TaxID=2022508 RepID=UPI000B9A3D5E|nr:hypothetical protein [Rhodococcus sp. 06-235-1A]OZD02460.1 hypothetical protein CH275_17730 [Rhodococcus sp. 06-235-1A]